jgi:hypothetical protein
MRFPLTIPSGTAVESLEVEIVDLLRGLKEYDRWNDRSWKRYEA